MRRPKRLDKKQDADCDSTANTNENAHIGSSDVWATIHDFDVGSMPVPAIPVCAGEGPLHSAPLTPGHSRRPGVHAFEGAAFRRSLAQPNGSAKPHENRDDSRHRHSAKLGELGSQAVLR